MNDSRTFSLTRWIRILHRDIGFFAIGLTVMYCISGIMLTYRDTDFLKSEQRIEKTIEPGLSSDQLGRILHLKGLKVLEESAQKLIFIGGIYDKQTGLVIYTSKEWPSLIRAFNNLHFVSSQDSRHWFTALYATALLFLALSSFFMYKVENSKFRRGLLISGSGLLFSLILLLM